MKKGLLAVLTLILIMFCGVYSFGAATLTRTSSNTIVFTEDYTTTEYYDEDTANPYVFDWITSGGGYAKPDWRRVWGWDGPFIGGAVDTNNGFVWGVSEVGFLSDGYNWRFDVYIRLYDDAGNSPWSHNTVLRGPSDSYYYGAGASRYPYVIADHKSNAVVVWVRRNSGNTWQLVAQKVNYDGDRVWNSGNSAVIIMTNYFSGHARGVYYNGYYYIVFPYGGYIRMAKLDESTGSIQWVKQVSSSATGSYYANVRVGPDGYLYVVWRNNSNVYIQRVDTNGDRVSWNGDTNDKVVNDNSYSQAYFWYGWTEDSVDLEIDKKNTNIYVVWSMKQSGESSAMVYMQKIIAANGGFSRAWAGDLKVSDDTCAEAYPDLAYDSKNDVLLVAWVTHRSDINDRILYRKVWPDGSKGTQTYLGYGHHLIVEGVPDNFYIFHQTASVNKFASATLAQLWSKYYADKSYFVRAFFGSKRVLPGVVWKARVIEDNVYKPTGSFVKYWLIGETNESTGFASTNGGVEVNPNEVATIPNPTHGLRYCALIDSYSNEGFDAARIYQLSVEAVEVSFADGLVGKAPDESDIQGELVDNYNEDTGQKVETYVYNDGTASAQGYVFVRNMGNITTNFQIKASPSPDYWTFKYWLCVKSGDVWVTNQDITADITDSDGITTNLAPYTDGSDEQVVIKVFLTPDSSLADGADAIAYVYTYSINGSGGYSINDVVGVRGIVTKAKPDLLIGYTTNASGDVIDYEGFELMNSDGAGQSRVDIADNNITRVFYIKVSNASGPDTIRVVGTGSGPGWKINYFDAKTGGTDITASVTGSGYDINLGLGGATEIRVEVTPTNGSAGQVTNIIVKGISQNNTAREDAVAITMTNVSSSVDIFVRSTNGVDAVGWTGYSTLNTTGAGQTLTNRADNSYTITYEFIVSNRGSHGMNITVYSTQSNLSAGWSVIYTDTDTGQDITALITNSSGYTISNLNNGSGRLIRVNVTPPSGTAGANENMGVHLIAKPYGDMITAGKQDVAGSITRCVNSKIDLIVEEGSNSSGYNVIDSNGTGEKIFRYITNAVTYTVIVSNAGLSSYDVNLKADVSNDGSGWFVHFYRGASDISSSIQSGSGYWTGNIPAGGTVSISVVVTGLNAGIDESNWVWIYGVSEINSSDEDKVHMVAERAMPVDLLTKKTNETSWHGNDAYSTNAASVDQSLSSSYPQGNTNYIYYLFKLQSERGIAEDVLLTSSIDTNGWDLKWWRYTGPDPDNPDYANSSYWVDITTSMTSSSGYTQSNVLPGTNILFRLDLRPDSATNEGDTANVDVVFEGLSTHFKDVGKASISYGMGIPDLVFLPAWDGVYEWSPTNQISTNTVDKAKGDEFVVVVQNDSAVIPGTFLFEGAGSTNQWVFKYYYGASDISAFVTNGGYSLSVGAGSSVTLKVWVGVLAGSTYGIGETIPIDLIARTELHEKVDEGRIVAVLTDRGKPDVFASSGDSWDNTYETTPSVQVTNTYIGWGDTRQLTFIIGNDRPTNENITVRGDGDKVSVSANWQVQYDWNNGGVWSNVSYSVTNSGEGFAQELNQNETITLRVTVTLGSNCSLSEGSLEEFNLWALSEAKLVEDKIKMQFTIKDYGVPDLVYISGWDNLYESNSVVIQKISTNIEKGWSNEVELLLQNDRTVGENLKVLGDGDSGDWKVRYFIWTGSSWNDVTADATNTGSYVFIPASSSTTLKVQSFVPKSSSLALGSTRNLNVKLYSWMGYRWDWAEIDYTIADMTIPDIALTNGLWDNDYNTTEVDIEDAKTNVYVEKGTNVVLILKVENDRTYGTNDFVITNTSGTGYWSVKYEVLEDTGWTNVTYETTDGGGYSTEIVALSNKLMRVTISLASNALYTTNDYLVVNVGVKSEFGEKSDYGRIVAWVADYGRPDVYMPSGEWSNVYYPVSQSTNVAIEKGDTVNFDFRVANNRTDRGESLKIKGSREGISGFAVSYLWWDGSAWQNVSYDVTNSLWSKFVEDQTNIVMRMQVSLDSNAVVNPGDVDTYTVRVLSFGELVTDQMSVSFVVTDLGRPDLVLTSDPDNWSNIYEMWPWQQVDNENIEIGTTNIKYVLIENDRAKNEIFTIKASGGDANWNVSYQWWNGSAWSNVTALITNSSGWDHQINSLSSETLKVVVYIPYSASVSIGSSKSLMFEMQSGMGWNYERGSITYTLVDNSQPNIVLLGGNWASYVELSPLYQSSNVSIEKDITNVVTLVLSNQRSEPDRFVIQGTGGRDFWNIGYDLWTGSSWSNITSLATNSGFDLEIPANTGETLKVYMFMPINTTNYLGDRYTVYVALRSWEDVNLGGSGVKRDKVKFAYRLEDMSYPDFVLQTNGITLSSWYELYEADPGIQKATREIEVGVTDTVFLFVSNNWNYAEAFLLDVDAYSNWGFQFYWNNGGIWSNVTYALTNNWILSNVSSHSAVTLKAEIVITTNDSDVAKIGDATYLQFSVESRGGHGFNVDRCKVNYVLYDFASPNIMKISGVWSNYVESSPYYQVQNVDLEKGITNTNVVVFVNERNQTDSYILEASGVVNNSNSWNTWFYWNNGGTWSNVTELMTNSSGWSVELDTAEKITMSIVMFMDIGATNEVEDAIDLILKMRSWGDANFGGTGTKRDEVKYHYEVVDFSQPDVVLATNGTPLASWNGVREVNPIAQIYTNEVELNRSNEVVVLVQNDRSDYPGLFWITATPVPYTNWQIQYLWLTNAPNGWSNVTEVVTNITNSLGLPLDWKRFIEPSTTMTMKIVSFVPYSTTNLIGDMLNVEWGMKSSGGYGDVEDRGRVIYKISDMSDPDIYITGTTWDGGGSGNGIVEKTPATQVKTIELQKGITQSVTLVLENKRTDEDLYVIEGTYPSSPWKLDYWLNASGTWTKVNDLITNYNGWETNLPPSSSVTLKITMFVDYDDTISLGETYDVFVSLRSWEDRNKESSFTKRDKVDIKFRIIDPSLPDIVVWGKGDGTTETTNSAFMEQSSNVVVEKGQQVVVPIWLQNDRTNTLVYLFRGDGGWGDWSVKYEVYTNATWNDVTAEVTNNGWQFTLSASNSNEARLTVELPQSSWYEFGSNITVWFYMESRGHLRSDWGKIFVSVTDYGEPNIVLADSNETEIDWSTYREQYVSYQVTNIRLEKGEGKTLYFVLKNERSQAENMTLRWFSTYTNQWSYAFYWKDGASWSNITVEVTNTNGWLVPLAANTNVFIRVDVEPDVSNTVTPSGKTNSMILAWYSQGRIVRDQVKINWVIVDPRPDLSALSLSSGGDIVGDDVYGTNNQQISGYVIMAEPAMYSLIVENDDALDDDYVLILHGDVIVSNKWQVEVYQEGSEDNIAASLTQGDIVYWVDGGSARSFRIKVYMLEGVVMNETNYIWFEVYSLKNTNRRDYFHIYTVRVPVNLSGRVIEKMSGRPVAGATIKFYNKLTGDLVWQGVSAADGSYSFETVPGTYVAKVTKQGYLDFETDVPVPEQKDYEADPFGLIRMNVDMTKFDTHPFPNPSTYKSSIRFVVSTPNGGHLKISIYDINGRKVRDVIDSDVSAGVHAITWDGRADDGKYVGVGLYFAIIENDDNKKIQKVFIKSAED